MLGDNKLESSMEKKSALDLGVFVFLFSSYCSHPFYCLSSFRKAYFVDATICKLSFK